MGLNYKNHDVSRVEAFSDAVFGFSATLLVVSLEVPDGFNALVGDLKGFAAFGLSFFALVMIWAVHNAFFRRYGLQDKMTVFINSCLLFVVLFYVYPLKFVTQGFASFVLGIGEGNIGIGSWDELALLFMLYSAGFVAVFLCFSMLYYNVYKSYKEFNINDLERVKAKFFFRHYGILCLVGLLSIVLAWFKAGISIGLPGWIYVILGPLAWGHQKAALRKQPALDLD